MAKQHKHATQSVSVVTVLSPDRLEELAKRATEKRTTSTSAAVMTGLTRGVQKVQVTGAGPAAVLLRVSAPMDSNLMSFKLAMAQDDGRTRLKSEITEYKTTKQTVMFVPVTPATMVAFDSYKEFCRRFVEAVRAEDASAHVTSSMW